MIAKALSHLLFAASIVNFFPVDGAILEWQAGLDVSTDSAVAQLLEGPAAHLPVAADRIIPPPEKVDNHSFGVVTSAQSAIVIDTASGTTLFAKNPNELRPIGSITKLMSALVFLDTQPLLTDIVTVTDEDFAGTGRVYLYYDDPVVLLDVLGASMVGSDNTATMALVRFSGLSTEDFVARMNMKAIELGMFTSRFEDPSGLSAQNVSTVGELAILLAEAKKQPILAEFMTEATLSITQGSGRVSVIPSTNQLLTSSLNAGDYRITGGKTGYIPQAGYCLATAIEHEGAEIYIVVLGASEMEDRFADAESLAGWTFKTFQWPTL
jgi:serine-type D-Ala-D-Ala endopeptidase (penicillin-binding protein 7)